MEIRYKIIIIVILFLTGAIVGSFTFFSKVFAQEEEDDMSFIELRQVMIKTQIEARGVKNKAVLDALAKVPRHKFLPQGYRALAYIDRPLPIGYGQTISQPYIVALMTELLELTGKERVLEIGTGSGYQAAVLAELSATVYTIEIIPALAKAAEELLEESGYKNIVIKHGDGYKGWPEHAPFDAIIVTCAPPEIPEALIEQLAEGGRMVIPVGSIHQELQLIRKEKGRIRLDNIIPVRFVPMVEDESN